MFLPLTVLNKPEHIDIMLNIVHCPQVTGCQNTDRFLIIFILVETVGVEPGDL
jgi:hypothetical protein